jgi:hypothetical protein
MHKLYNYFQRFPMWVWLLSFIVAIQCFSMAKPILLADGSHAFRYLTRQVDLAQADESDVERSLDAIITGTATEADYASFDSVDLAPSQRPQSILRALDHAWGAALVLVGIGALCIRRHHKPLAILLGLTSLWCMVDSMSAVLNGGVTFAYLSPYGAAARTVTPLLLATVLSGLPTCSTGERISDAYQSLFGRRFWLNAFDWCARIGIAVTFASHGHKAIAGDYYFQDLIILSARRIGLDLPTNTTLTLLDWIGYQDVLLTFAVLLTRTKWVLYWIAVWGLITAISRITAMGFEVFDLSLVRIANGGLALVLLAFYAWLSRCSSNQNSVPISGLRFL